MLGYEAFKAILKEQVQKDIGESACLAVVTGNNGQKREVITIIDKKFNLLPAVHLQELYEEFREGKTMEACAGYVKGTMETKVNIKTEAVFGRWEKVKERVKIRLINREWNQERLEGIPHRDFLDLAIIFRFEVPIREDITASCDIGYWLLKHWGITETELEEAAYENLKKEEYSIWNIQELVQELVLELPDVEPLLPLPLEKEGYMYTMCNPARTHGAAGMLRTDLLQEFADEQGCDVFLLPSSIHEIMLLPDRNEFPAEELKDMVRRVNQTEVKECDRLSDEIYYFRRDTGKVELVSEKNG